LIEAIKTGPASDESDLDDDDEDDGGMSFEEASKLMK